MSFVTVTRTRRARPHGLDRAVMRLGLALVRWGRRRAERGTVDHEQQALRLAVQRDLEARDRAIAIDARVGLR